jgi:hypothetical protein
MGDYINIDLREFGCEYVGWIQASQYRVQLPYFVNTVMKLQVP